MESCLRSITHVIIHGAPLPPLSASGLSILRYPPILQLPLCSILHYTPPTHSAAAPHFSYLISRQQRLTYVLVVLICTSYLIHLIWNVNWCLFASLRGIHFGLHCSKIIPTPALISFISHCYISFFSKWPFFQSQWSSYTKWSLLQQDCSKTILYSCSFSSFLCPFLSHSSIKLFVFEDSKLVYVNFKRIASTVCIFTVLYCKFHRVQSMNSIDFPIKAWHLWYEEEVKMNSLSEICYIPLCGPEEEL